MAESQPIACTLTEQEIPHHAAGLARLGASLSDVETHGARARLRFQRSGSSRAAVDELVAAESRCCPFFDFEVEERDDELTLAIEAPPNGTPMTRAVVAAIVVGWMPPA